MGLITWLTLRGAGQPQAGQPERRSESSRAAPSYFEVQPDEFNGQPPAPRPAHLETSCGSCHYPPDPEVLPRGVWYHVLRQMVHYSDEQGQPLSPQKVRDIASYYLTHGPESLPLLVEEDPPSDLGFQSEAFGDRAGVLPMITNLNVVDLDRDAAPDVLVCDSKAGAVTWCRRVQGRWVETALAAADEPVHTAVLDFEGDGDLDVAVAVIGNLTPSDSREGSVLLLLNDGRMSFRSISIHEHAPRVTDVEPADLDGDGDVDFLVGMFGWRKLGGVGWIEQIDPAKFAFHWILERSGCIHVPVADLDGDGRPDFVALFAQQHEQVSAFLNRGGGLFEPHILYEARNPCFGSSGIQLVDLDRDGDLDVLYSNGDLIDTVGTGPLPYHGVQWLENLGGLQFAYHDLTRFYGVYRAVAGDLDGDGDLDVVFGSMFNFWNEPSRHSLLWLENDGKQRFTRHPIDRTPTHIPTVALGDMNQDGRMDILAGCMPISEPYDRARRVTLWTNQGKTR